MPEGDTLFRIAQRVDAALAGETVVSIEAADPALDVALLVDTRLNYAQSRGKHLLLGFANGYCVHSHLGMTGSWHVYATGEAWRKPARQARLQLRFPSAVLVGFNLPRLKIESQVRAERDPLIASLGPDLLADDFALEMAVSRLRQHPALAVGEAIMDQRLVAGVGNVYKSELLFLGGLHPTTPLGNISDEQLTEFLASGRRSMQRNLTVARRRFRHTTYGGRLWVYRRAGRPCYRCGTTIAMLRQGEAIRSSYFCPTCQPVAAGDSSHDQGRGA